MGKTAIICLRAHTESGTRNIVGFSKSDLTSVQLDWVEAYTRALIAATGADAELIYGESCEGNKNRCMWCSALLAREPAAVLEHFKQCPNFPDADYAKVLRSRRSRKAAETRRKAQA